jgi:hypothetical protein
MYGPQAQLWWYLSCKADAARQVVLACEPGECAELHSMPLPPLETCSKPSTLTMATVHMLSKALINDHGNTLWTPLDILRLHPFTAEETRTYIHGDGALRRMADKNATPKQRSWRAIYNKYLLKTDNLDVIKSISDLFREATPTLRTDLAMAARSIACGFVQLSPLDQFRDVKVTGGFVSKATLLQRLQLPERYSLKDVP